MAVFLAFLPAGLGAQVATGFDSDLEGWLVTGDNAVEWQPAGGNPGGYLDVNDEATGPQNWVIAPPEYLGDWSAATSADTLSVDYLFSTSDPDLVANPTFTISGPGGSARSALIVPPEGAWTTFSVFLDPADWEVTSGSWPSILANVTSLRVAGEFVTGNEELGVDNVELSLSPNAVQNNCVLDTFNDGTTGDWSFLDSDVSSPASGGNGGGYVEIDDGSGTSYALAPSSFRGDWSSLDGSGRITVDLRLLDASGAPAGATEFLRLTGPGGVARWELESSEVPTNPFEWKRLNIPLNAVAWTVESGSWSTLLDEVTEVRLQLEVIDGDETLGFDNFGRLALGCAVADGDVTVLVSDVSISRQISFPGISSVAFNPADGELYGLLPDSGADDGLYPVTGAQARVRVQEYDRPAHLIFDQDGDAFISENFEGDVFRYDFVAASSSLWVSGFHSGDDDPYGFAFAPPGFDGDTVDPGDLLVADHGSGGPKEIWTFSPDLPEGEAFLAATGSQTVYDLAAGPTSEVWGTILQDGSNLLRIDAQGNLTQLALTADVGSPTGIVYDPSADVFYVAGEVDSTYAVHRIDRVTGSVERVAEGFEELGPASVELEGDLLWVVDRGWDRVYELVLRPEIFSDGFESGDTSAWSSSQGR